MDKEDWDMYSSSLACVKVLYFTTARKYMICERVIYHTSVIHAGFYFIVYSDFDMIFLNYRLGNPEHISFVKYYTKCVDEPAIPLWNNTREKCELRFAVEKTYN
ncbi:hypothetical protein MCI89_00920 [Muricomes sp. OA1]|nr:hypothetical protein [Muricomes sp. OA1]